MRIYALSINYTSVTPSTVLNLSTEKDIKLFQAGDVIQGNAIEVKNSNLSIPLSLDNPPDGNSRNLSNTFNGSDAGGFYSGTKQSFSYEVHFGVPLEGQYFSAYITDLARIQYFFDDGTDITVPNTNGSAMVVAEADAGSTKKLTHYKHFAVGTNTNDQISNFKVDRTSLLWSSISNVKVTATDVSAKTITVDGGDWDTSNQSQVWSDNISGTVFPSYSKQGAFDGETTATLGWIPASGTTGVWTANNLAYSSKVRIYAAVDKPANGPSISAVLSGASTDITPGASQTGWIDVAIGSGTLDSITISMASVSGDAYIELRAVEVDGKILVDAVDDSQVWSNSLTGSTQTPAENAFDGKIISTFAQGATGTTLTFTPLTPIPYTNSVRVHTQYSGDLKLNPGTASEVTADPAGVVQWTTLVNGSSGTITQITGTGTNKPTWDAIEVDGKLLVDRGVRDLGDTKVSTASPKRGEGTISDITGNVVTIEPFTDNCFKEGDYLTVNKVIEINPKTDAITTYDSNTDTLNVNGVTDLLQFADGDAVFMTDGTTNPDGSYKQTGYKLVTSDIESVATSNEIVGWTLSDMNENAGVYYNDQTTWSTTLSFSGGTPKQSYIRFVISYVSVASCTITGDALDAPVVIDFSNVSDPADGAAATFFPNAASGDLTVNFAGGTGQTNIIRVNTNTSIEDYNQKYVPLAPALSDVTLTFADPNPDLEYFQAGDVVQAGGLWSTMFTGEFQNPNTDLPPNEWVFADPQDANTAAAYSKMDGSTLLKWSPKGLSEASQVRILYRSSGTHQVFINDQDASSVLPTLIAGDVTVDLSEFGGGLQSISYISSNSTNYFGLKQIYIDGVRLLDSNAPSEVKVISTGYAQGSNTMVVDGGDWVAVDAQTWSNGISNSDLQTPAASFDGDLNTGAGTTNTSADPMVYTIPAELQSKDLVVYVAGGNSTPSEGYIEFGSNGFNPVSIGTPFTTTINSSYLNGFYLNVPSGTTQIKFATTSVQRGCHLLGLKANGTLLIDNETNGDRHVEYQTNGGEGTVASTNTATQTMVLSASNDRWIAENKAGAEFFVAGATKPAVSMTAYLDFDANGQNTELTSVPQSGVNMNNLTTPQIFFPALFATGEAPDTDIPEGSYIQTKVIAKNIIGAAPELTSNAVVPSTTTYSVPAAGSVRYTTEEFGEFCRWACSSDYRTAIKTIQDTESTIAEFRDKALDAAQAYIDAQE